jgi:ABC-type transporter Mla subunit MlaD
MRGIAYVAAALALAAVAVGIIKGSSGSGGGPYTVRAIFDDASFAVQGEDVRIAGANVGTIQSLGVTAGKRAAVTLSISNSGFTPFHADASCTIRPQSLIGEQYVDCNPGTSSAPPLNRITSGPGTGSHLLPVTRTSSPIDQDIVQNISTEPVRQSLAVIINEFGTGLAARGSDLNAVIRRANPALGETDKVLQILARQNRQLARLATNSQTVLAPLARERARISEFVTQANTTSSASAQRAADISKTFALFPSYLRQLRPLMADLGSLADQGTPLLNSLGQSASALGRQFANLTPFASAARRSLIELGAAAQQSQPYLIATMPLDRRLLKLGNAALPSARSLDRLTASLNNTGGIEQLMGVLFNGAVAGNGFNSLGHYVRDEPLVSSCTNYATSPVPGCSSNFVSSSQAPRRGVVSSATGRAGRARTATTRAGRAHTPTTRAGRAHTPTTRAGRARAAKARAAAVNVVVQAVRRTPARSTSDLKGLLGYLVGGQG